MKYHRAVFDTSTMVSAALRVGSIPHGALKLAYRTTRIFASPETLQELEEVLLRPKFDRYLDRETREIFLTAYRNAVQLVVADSDGVGKKELSCRDAGDNKFLAAALVANADVLISSDRDLLVLHPWSGVSILTPADFLAQSQDH